MKSYISILFILLVAVAIEVCSKQDDLSRKMPNRSIDRTVTLDVPNSYNRVAANILRRAKSSKSSKRNPKPKNYCQSSKRSKSSKSTKSTKSTGKSAKNMCDYLTKNPSATPTDVPTVGPMSPSFIPTTNEYGPKFPSITPSTSNISSSKPSSSVKPSNSAYPSKESSLSNKPSFSSIPSTEPLLSPDPVLSYAPSMEMSSSLKPSVSSKSSIEPSVFLNLSIEPSQSTEPTMTLKPSRKPSLSPSSEPSLSARPSVSNIPSFIAPPTRTDSPFAADKSPSIMPSAAFPNADGPHLNSTPTPNLNNFPTTVVPLNAPASQNDEGDNLNIAEITLISAGSGLLLFGILYAVNKKVKSKLENDTDSEDGLLHQIEEESTDDGV